MVFFFGGLGGIEGRRREKEERRWDGDGVWVCIKEACWAGWKLDCVWVGELDGKCVSV